LKTAVRKGQPFFDMTVSDNTINQKHITVLGVFLCNMIINSIVLFIFGRLFYSIDTQYIKKYYKIFYIQ